MFCKHCGSKLPENAPFCPVCGAAPDLGKQKCRILKEIRQRIADENDIPFVTRDCRYRGECAGTCPTCEAELRYLEQELEKRENRGEEIRVAGLYPGPSSAEVRSPGSASRASGDTMPADDAPWRNMTPGIPARPDLRGDERGTAIGPRFPETAGIPAAPPKPSRLERLRSWLSRSKVRRHD